MAHTRPLWTLKGAMPTLRSRLAYFVSIAGCQLNPSQDCTLHVSDHADFADKGVYKYIYIYIYIYMYIHVWTTTLAASSGINMTATTQVVSTVAAHYEQRASETRPTCVRTVRKHSKQHFSKLRKRFPLSVTDGGGFLP